MSSVKFKNPGEQTVRISTIEGHSAIFEPGETVEVPEVLRTACLAANLTPVKGGTTTSKAQAAPTAGTADDNETKVNAG